MKNIALIIVILLSSLRLFGQQPANTVPKPYRQVSGMIRDTTGDPLPGATIKLKSAKDSLVTISDDDGVFVFENVKMATFLLTISEIGFTTRVRKYLNNDANAKIVIAPITLLDNSINLKEITVNGRPSIVYKPDTVEFRASDYRVPANATVDELLKRVPGMELGVDGSLSYQGQQVTQAKLNGKTFAGGDVKQAIQNLPADIVDKIQIVDDYGEQAARTGIKTGEPQKSLNITTRADKSIGTTGRLTGQYGNDDRYNAQLFVQHLNANQVYGLIGNLKNTVNGVASSGTSASPIGATGKSQTSITSDAGTSSSPGTTRSGLSTVNYRNDWGRKVEAIASYTYGFIDNTVINSSYGQTNSTRGASIFSNQSNILSNAKSHNVKLEIDYTIDRANYLQVNPFFGYNNSNTTSSSSTNNLNYFTSGFEHPVANKVIDNQNENTNYGLTVLFVHAFKKPTRNFSVLLGYNNTRTKANGDNNSAYRYYPDTTQNASVKDSVSHLLTQRNSNNQTFQSVLTYVEPLSQHSKLEFTSRVRIADYDDKAISDTILANGDLSQLTRLDNIYKYTFTETYARVGYRYSDKKLDFTLGAAAIPTVLSGTQEDNNTSTNISTSRSDFRIIPVFNFAYSWSQTERLTVSYSGANNEPNFQQIQPFVDRSDPNNIIVGNPDIKPTFTHFVRAGYNNYFANEKINLSLNFNGQLYDNQTTTNILQLTIPLTTTTSKTINEVHYVNISGNKAFTGNYSLSKIIENGTCNVVLNGTVNYNYTNALSNNLTYHTEQWQFNERLGPRLILDDNKIQINPFVGYTVDKSSTNTINATPTAVQSAKLAMDGLIYLPQSLQVHFYAGKNYISGIRNYSRNPFIINMGLEKRFVKLKNLGVTFDVFDLLHQNNFVQQSITTSGTTYTQSNIKSRYFLIGLVFNLQHWGGTPTKDGQPMKRRGDGSFIN